MSLDPNYKAVLVILKDIEAHGMVQLNKEYQDDDFFQNFIEFKKAFSHSMSELVSKLDIFQTKPEEIIIFTVYSELSYINSHLEVIKKFFKTIINPEKINGGFDDDTTLEEMIKKICNNMQYSEKLKNSIRGLFLADFRDAIVHQHYLIDKKGELIIYPQEKRKQILTLKNLADKALQIMEIFDAMLDWANGKTRTENKKSQGLDEIVGDLTKQVDVLDKKLDKLS